MFAASSVNILDNYLSHHQPGNNLYGLDARLSRLAPKGTVEPFLFWRVTPRPETEEGTHGTFDQLYPNIHDHLGLADQFARQNLKAIPSGMRVWLRTDWIVAAAWNDYWLASTTDGYYKSSGTIVARDPGEVFPARPLRKSTMSRLLTATTGTWNSE